MSEMSKIVKTVSNILFPLIMIFGLYVIAHGHLTPGGGFQGGAIVASGCALLLVAYGSTWVFKHISEKKLSLFESLGAFGFILVAFLGLGVGGMFFNNFMVGTESLFGTIPPYQDTAADFNTGGVLPLMNFAVGVKVIAGLFIIILIMAFVSTSKRWKQ
ncbi:MAG: MnhB domain-containing protein [Candidatus Thermoplasmatota archaeon]